MLETLQTALSGGDLYYWFSSGFGNIDHLMDPYASAFDVPIIGSIVSGAVQYFFVYRVWVLSDRKSWWLCVVISVVSQTYGSNIVMQPRAHLILVFCFQHCSSVCWWYLCKTIGLRPFSFWLTIAGARIQEVY
jgi:hypothetical protein